MENFKEQFREMFTELNRAIEMLNSERREEGLPAIPRAKVQLIELIDPESALVSKAVKAPEKNKQLIREAVALEVFPKLVDRILANGGKLEDFI